MKQLLLIGASIIISTSSCVIVQPHEVGVKQKMGKLQEKVYEEGPHGVFFARLRKVPIRNNNLKINLDIPSREGLTIQSEMSILYHIEKSKVLSIVRDVGMTYEKDLIAPVFRSALANTSAQFYAKDMHSGKRGEIEAKVKEILVEKLADRGFVIDAVLMKRIVLPKGLSNAIEEKLEAEQDAQRMEFTLEKERREAERALIEAEGKKKVALVEAEARGDQKLVEAEADKKVALIRADADQQVALTIAEADKQTAVLRAQGEKEANQLLTKGLTREVLRLRAIEAFEKLSESANSKTIITDGSGEIFNIDTRK